LIEIAPDSPTVEYNAYTGLMCPARKAVLRARIPAFSRSITLHPYRPREENNSTSASSSSSPRRRTNEKKKINSEPTGPPLPLGFFLAAQDHRLALIHTPPPNGKAILQHRSPVPPPPRSSARPFVDRRILASAASPPFRPTVTDGTLSFPPWFFHPVRPIVLVQKIQLYRCRSAAVSVCPRPHLPPR
jgi:hypothetical protein